MTQLSRRRFAKLLTLSTSAALLPRTAQAMAEWGLTNAPLPPTPQSPDERFWRDVRARFVLPPDVAFMNAANLCPAPLPVIETLDRETRLYEADPSPGYRSGLMRRGREEARKLIAASLGVTPDEIVLTRNTSEANNFVSNGLQLGPDDEVIVFSDNHPTNLTAWREKSKRFGYTVSTLQHVVPHPGAEYYVDLFAKAITPRTRLIAFTHLTSNSGDLFPAAEMCRMARERGVLTLLDGAQTFGALDVNLGQIRPDFYSGSAHKWPCGPKETGVLFVNRDVHDRIWPSVIGVYAGAVGISQKLEGMGQRDDARLAVLAEAVRFRESIGRTVIERRGRELAAALMEGVKKLDGVTVYTDPAPDRSGAIVVLRPGNLDPRRLGAALAEREKIVATIRAGQDRPGLRFAPHLYNTMAEIDRTVGAIRKYLASGV
ncbi:MAG TPA: aminotransferase class V-fold PLP-dependent enzyme [Gemmatimonadaceae bacterium]|nr:aminotransferase class V-fold PLP-dependent enzyme [Gemmatimonadaceae bacterium]